MTFCLSRVKTLVTICLPNVVRIASHDRKALFYLYPRHAWTCKWWVPVRMSYIDGPNRKDFIHKLLLYIVCQFFVVHRAFFNFVFRHRVCLNLSCGHRVCLNLSFGHRVCLNLSFGHRVCLNLSFGHRVCLNLSFGHRVCMNLTFGDRVCINLYFGHCV